MPVLIDAVKALARMGERALHQMLCWTEIALAVLIFAILRWLVAPYGRHRRQGFGPTLPARVGWLIMESPSWLLWGVVYAFGTQRAERAPLVLAALWQGHYLYRGLVYPFRLRPTAQPMPLLVVASGFVFCALNAYLNARWLSALGRYDVGWLIDPRFLLGATVYVAGMLLNRRADAQLLALGRDADGRYRLPHGGLFERVSCPNYLGEIIAWFGWAMATWSCAGLAFALFTLANLAPRARAHHAWYQRYFPEYPPRRRALLPW